VTPIDQPQSKYVTKTNVNVVEREATEEERR
jgi:hypothetical protein